MGTPLLQPKTRPARRERSTTSTLSTSRSPTATLAEEHEVGHPRPGDDRTPEVGGDHRVRRDPIGDERHGDGCRLDDRVGEPGVTGLFEEEHQPALIESQSSDVLTCEKAEHPDVRELVPHRAVRRLVIPRAAYVFGPGLLGEHVAHGVTNGTLIVVEAELHRPLPR
jgi:hypothetical protein